MKSDLHVVSFSGGKDSTAMLIGMKEKGMQIDMVLYCDTTVEFPEMYDHIKKVESFIDIPITKLSASHSYEYYLLDHMKKTRTGEFVKGYSFAGTRSRWCTSKLKTDVINRFLSELKDKYNIIQYVGIASDEQYRIKDLNYPLVDWGWTEADCLQYCYDKGFDFGGLYEIFHRVSCWCCPLQSLDELRKLRKNFPDLWKQLQEWQLKTWRKFRPDFSVQELEIRFSLEDEWIADGKEINPKKESFRKELKRRLERKGEMNAGIQGF